jgi:hypothetical protein
MLLGQRYTTGGAGLHAYLWAIRAWLVLVGHQGWWLCEKLSGSARARKYPMDKWILGCEGMMKYFGTVHGHRCERRV